MRTTKRINTSLKTVTPWKSMGNNESTITRKSTNKKSSEINKNMTKKKIRKRLISLKRYIVTSSFLKMTHSREDKNLSRILRKWSLLIQYISHIWRTAWEYDKPTKRKTLVKRGNKKTTTSSHWGSWKRY